MKVSPYFDADVGNNCKDTILAYSIVVAIAFTLIALLLLGKNKAGKGDALADHDNMAAWRVGRPVKYMTPDVSNIFFFSFSLFFIYKFRRRESKPSLVVYFEVRYVKHGRSGPGRRRWLIVVIGCQHVCCGIL